MKESSGFRQRHTETNGHREMDRDGVYSSVQPHCDRGPLIQLALLHRPSSLLIRSNQGPGPVPINELICIVAQWLKRLEVNPD